MSLFIRLSHFPRFRAFVQLPFQTLPSRRSLHNTFMSTTEKVLLISNAGTFALLWSLTQSPQAHELKANLEKFKVFYRKPWFCDIHPDHNDNKWGQSPLELPRFVREIFMRHISPSHDPKEPITFFQNRELHNYAYRELCNVLRPEQPVVINNSININKVSDGYEISVDGRTSKIAANAIFYNWLKIPRKQELLTTAENSDGSTLYKLPKNFFVENAPAHRIIILGASPLIPWIFRDFKEVKTVFMIKRKDDEIPQIPRNGIDFEKDYTERGLLVPFFIDSKKITTSKGEECEFRNVDPNGYVAQLKYHRFTPSSEGGFDKITQTGHFFSSIGQIPDPAVASITRKIEWRERGTQHWVAPRNVPSGSLTGSYQDWMRQMEQTKQFYDTQTYFSDDIAFRSAFKNHFEPQDSVLHRFIDDKFTPIIDCWIRGLETCKPDEEFHEHFENTFHKHLREHLSQYINKYTKR